MTEEKQQQLVLVVEGTAALGPYWQTIVSDYLEKVIRKFCGTEATEATSSNVELALVQFNAHGSYSSCLVQRSGWVRNVDYFLEWLSCMHFSGGGFRDAAIAEGLAEVLMICPSSNGTQTQPSDALQRHCILVAASNPSPLPMPVYRPPSKNEIHSESCLSDAETIAKSFPQSCVSLSVISPKQLPKLKEIYYAGKRTPSTTAPTIDTVKNPHYLVLISEDFMEACAALCPSGTPNSPSNESPSNVEATSVSPVSEPPPASVSPANLSPTQKPVSVGNIPMATVKVEPSTVSPVSSPQAVKTKSPLSTSRELISSNDDLQDLKSVVTNIQRPFRPAGPGNVNMSILNNLSQARLVSPNVPVGGKTTGVTSIGGSPMLIHMSSMISGSGSAPLVGTAQVAQHAGTMMGQQVQGLQSAGVSNMGTNAGLSQQTSSAPQSGRPKYVKIWEGELRGKRQNQNVTITRLEAYASSPSAEALVKDWPSALVIDRLISQSHINGKKQVAKCEFIAFRALNQHGFLGQMQEKKLCTVVRLPSQTLLLSITDKACRLMGMLLPGDMVVFKPDTLSQQPSQQQQRFGQGTSDGARGESFSQGQVSSPGPKPEPE